MTIAQLRERVADRLGISTLNVMQQTMARQKLPCRVVLSAPTGAGKSVAFTLPLLASLPAPEKRAIGLLLSPTRELALQIFEVVRTLAAPEYKTCVLYGGHNMHAEQASVAAGPDIITATPGRLLDHIERGNLSLDGIRSVVIDEYDKALELGFLKELKAIVKQLHGASTLILTSATASTGIPEFINARGLKYFNFTGDDVPAPDLAIAQIKSPDTDKLDTLADVLRQCGGRTLVFVNYREATERVATAMKSAGLHVGIYHGAMEQDRRERALILFNNGTTPILVATDIAARGLDMPQVRYVIHYHMPQSVQSWTHRNGRGGRQGASAGIIVITNEKDKIPEFISFNASTVFEPDDEQQQSPVATLYLNAGRRDKISKGDIAGYILHNCALEVTQLGRIDLCDHSAYVAIPAEMVSSLMESLKDCKLKGRRVRISPLKE